MQVSHYLWPENSAIEQMDVSALASGRLEARIYASPGQEHGSLALIPHHLKKAGYSVINDSDEEGRYLLRVTGFDKAEDLLDALQKDSLIPPPEQCQRSGKEEKKSLAQTVRSRAINLAGISAVTGHLSLILTGYLLKVKSYQVAGATFAATNTLAALRGTGEKGGEVDRIIHGMYEKLNAEGIKIPDLRTATVEEMGKEGGVVQQVWNTVVKKPTDFVLNKHPYETGQIAALLANAYMAVGERAKQNSLGGNQKKPEKSMYMRINAATSFLGGVTLGFVPPKPHNAKGSKKEEQNPLGKVKDFLQDHNQGIGAFFNTVSNLAAAIAAKEAIENRGIIRQASQTGSIPMRMNKQTGKMENLLNHVPTGKDITQRNLVAVLTTLTAAAWFIDGGLTAISTKKRGRDYADPEVAEHVSAMCAEVLLRTPEDMRSHVIDEMSDYLGRDQEISFSKEEVKKTIEKKISALQDSPWQNKVSTQRMDTRMPIQQPTGIAT